MYENHKVGSYWGAKLSEKIPHSWSNEMMGVNQDALEMEDDSSGKQSKMSHLQSVRQTEGNVDERVTDRILYDILIQAGRVVDLHIPRDRETDKPKGFAFAEYETEEIAEYAVRLFTGLVTLYKRTLKFGISGQDKASANVNSVSIFSSNSPLQLRFHPVPFSGIEDHHSTRLSSSGRFSTNHARYEQGKWRRAVGGEEKWREDRETSEEGES